jgi:hypothetical protein
MENIKFYSDKIQQLENKAEKELQEEIEKICKKHNLSFYAGMGTWFFDVNDYNDNFGEGNFLTINDDCTFKRKTFWKKVWKDFKPIHKYAHQLNGIMRTDNILSWLNDVKAKKEKNNA